MSTKRVYRFITYRHLLEGDITEQVDFYVKQVKFTIVLDRIAVIHLAVYFKTGLFLLISDQSLMNNRIRNLLSLPLI